jgi:hypothetical protein
VVAGAAEPSRNAVVTALRLAKPAALTNAVDGVPRALEKWQPVTITTNDWRLLYSIPSEQIELYEPMGPPSRKYQLDTLMWWTT